MKILKLLLIIIGFLLFFISAFLMFEPGNDPTGLFVYSPGLAVKTIENNAAVGSTLIIEFMTLGTNNLTITALEGDIEIVELKCNSLKIEPSADNFYHDYSCKEYSSLSVIPKSKESVFEIKFGHDSQKIKNKSP